MHGHSMTYLSIAFGLLFFILIHINETDFTTSISHAHNFDTDDNSTLLTLLNKLSIENRLINNSLSNNGDDHNDIISFKYVDNVEKIIDDILIAEDSFLVDSDQFYNNTIIATMVANLADDVLRKYGTAFGIPSNIMLGMNFSKVITLERDAMIVNKANHSSGSGLMYAYTLKDPSEYYNAFEISKRMIEIYDLDLSGFNPDTAQKNLTLLNLKESLNELNKAIKTFAFPSKIMEIVHTKVHPNLQMTFDLSIKR